MVTDIEIEFFDQDTKLLSTKAGYTYTKKPYGVEILYRNSDKQSYTVNVYPWHTIRRFGVYGTKEA